MIGFQVIGIAITVLHITRNATPATTVSIEQTRHLPKNELKTLNKMAQITQLNL